MKIKIKLNKKDLLFFSIYNILHRYTIYFSSLILAFFLFYKYKNFEFNFYNFLFFILYFVISFIIFFLLSILLTNFQKNKKFLEERIYELNDKEIKIHWNEAIYPIKWKEFKKIKRFANYIYLFISPIQALIFPISQLSKEQLLFLNKIAKKINKNKK